MRRSKALVGAVALAATIMTTVGAQTASEAKAYVATTQDLVVGSYNLSSVSFDGQASGDHRTWRERRPTVVSQIMQQKLDVVGLQEANQSTKYAAQLDYGDTQYKDLKGALAAKGAAYALTNEDAYNCQRAWSSNNCVFQDRQASQDNRILYNTRTLTLVRSGAVKYNAQTVGKNERYLVWAVFAQKSNGKQFFFTNTHLDPYQDSTRKAQWDEVISNTNRLKGGLPVVTVGDYNTSKFDSYASTYLPRMKQNGYGDVLNQQYGTPWVTQQRAESLRRGWVNSFNGWKRDVRSYAYEDAQGKIGNNIDFIFASSGVRVREWAVVVNLDLATMRIKGVIPSDHALVRATLTLS